MNTLNTKTELKFNWDDIDVGNLNLDNSENFFAQKHFKHEKFENKNGFYEEVEEENVVYSFEPNKENKEPLNLQDLNDAINCLSAAAAAGDKIKDSKNIKSQPRKSMLPSDLKTIKNIEDTDDNGYCDAKQNLKDNNIVNDIAKVGDEIEAATTTTTTMTTVQQVAKKNLMLEWSTHATFKGQQRPTTAAGGGGGGGAAAAVAAPPKAYVFKDIYQQKREEVLRKLEDEERKSREFHSRPMPNFKACHAKTLQRPIAHAVTCPKTPLTLKTWRSLKELRKQKQEEESQKQKIMQKPKPRSVAYLRNEPFKPKLPEPTVVDQKPFRLGTEHRLQLRREYNATVQKAHEDQKKQEEEESRKQEVAILKEIRKMTQFKARPNPFK